MTQCRTGSRVRNACAYSVRAILHVTSLARAAFCDSLLRFACVLRSTLFMLADEEMPCRWKAQKTVPTSDAVQSTNAARTFQQMANATDRTILDYAQDSHLGCMWELLWVYAGSMQLLTAEQALAAAASGSAVVQAVCTHQR